jgi:hypothetical protein
MKSRFFFHKLAMPGVKQGSLHFGQGVKQKLRTIV